MCLIAPASCPLRQLFVVSLLIKIYSRVLTFDWLTGREVCCLHPTRYSYCCNQQLLPPQPSNESPWTWFGLIKLRYTKLSWEYTGHQCLVYSNFFIIITMMIGAKLSVCAGSSFICTLFNLTLLPSLARRTTTVISLPKLGLGCSESEKPTIW